MGYLSMMETVWKREQFWESHQLVFFSVYFHPSMFSQVEMR